MNLLLLLGGFLAIHISMGIPSIINEQQSLHVPVEDDAFQEAFPAPLVRYGDEETCKKKFSKTIATFAKCPEDLRPFAELTSYANECAGLSQFGCEIQFISGMLTCTFNVERAKEHVVCPGEKIVFEKVNINQFNYVRYLIDLRADPLKTDVYILSDATGSMGRAIQTAKDRANDLLELFKTSEDTAFGVGFYRDEQELVDGFQNVQSITTDHHAAKKAIGTLHASGGLDADEANLIALYKVATDPSIGWRPKSRRIIVYFGDYPGHEPSCVKGVDRTLTRTVVAEALEKERISVLAVDFGKLNAAPISFGCGFKSGTRAAVDQARYIAERTNGAIVSSSDQSKLIELIHHLIRNMPRTFDYDDRSCGGNVISVHSPRMPLELSVGDSMTVTNTMNLQKGICETKGKFKCEIKYSESGADLKPTEIEIVDIVGCPEK